MFSYARKSISFGMRQVQTDREAWADALRTAGLVYLGALTFLIVYMG
ncbi:hypothetical protein KCG44_12305 [Pacificimonas sp. WHA3]|uniref:Uncharacterized protein n=1 Tax=Pacificimonas pallii TaxID=2827236 RepID=A0ABS6SI75_9SPHN|nr:hypothetical protein [Pacificimonas pallii]MBV7257567.1 hypothetical protein [Pacificimonas pallii]